MSFETALLDLPAPIRDASPRLRALERPRPARRPRHWYGVIAVAGALTIAAAQMTLSILTTEGSYEVAALSAQQRDLSWQKQIVQDDIAGLSSPQYLAANASALGMVIGGVPNHLRLSDGAVVGAAAPADSRSAVDALAQPAVPNGLVSGLPLVTDPAASLGTAATVDDAEAAADVATPPPISDGLPTPETH